MVYNNEYCQQHPNHLIGGIYKDKQNNSKIQRKVCMQCILKFQIPPNQISKEDFIKCLLQRSDQLNLYNQLEQNQYQSILKTVLHQINFIQEEISLVLKHFSDSVKRISDEQTIGDENFLKFINENLNPFECSQSELDFLVNFLEGTSFEDWIKKKIMVTSQVF